MISVHFGLLWGAQSFGALEMIDVAGVSVRSGEAGVWCSSNNVLVVLGLAFSDGAAWI